MVLLEPEDIPGDDHGGTSRERPADHQRVPSSHAGLVLHLHEVEGGRRLLRMAAGELLPRIC